MATTAIIVPCRLESTRFPRKLLHPIQGRPLVLHVAERIRNEVPELPLYFAVDDQLLATPLIDAGFQVIHTRASHQSGTDRLAEANRTIRAEYVINVQADEPLVSASQIRLLAKLIQGEAPMATLCTPFTNRADFENPNQVKVVLGIKGRALYFSRAPIPYSRDHHGSTLTDAWVQSHPCYRHLGLYAYKARLLESFITLPMGRMELIEKLEQLRVLENGYDIVCGETIDPTIGVDTPEDVERYAKLLAKA